MILHIADQCRLDHLISINATRKKLAAMKLFLDAENVSLRLWPAYFFTDETQEVFVRHMGSVDM